jgi:hypothetical protein
MKRALSKLLLLLLAGVGGATLNVAMAWGLALSGPENRNVEAVGEFVETDDPAWFLRVVDEFGSRFVYAQAGYSSAARAVDVPHWSYASKALTARDADDFVIVIEQARGWPCLAMFGRITQGGLESEKTDGILNSPVFAKKNRMFSGNLPCKPIWPGFAINTIFYAAIVWGLFAVPGFIKRRRRIKRGLCQSCGYDLRRSLNTICAECGKGLDSR